MAQVRRAEAHWSGDLNGGGGAVSAVSSRIFTEQAITWRGRTEVSEGTSPEELLAAAHAACYSMAVSNELAKAGHAPERVDVTAEVTGDKREAGWTVLASKLTLRARVPGIDQATFDEKADAARSGCPISRAISDSVEITLEATLES